MELWRSIAAGASIELSDAQVASLSAYIDLLLEANAKMNLTRIADRASAEVLHVGDALTALPLLPKQAHELADVGSGGGVPGIPLAIARPDVKFMLMESSKKKANFMRETVAELELQNVLVLAERAEHYGAVSPGRFDVVTARAVAALDQLLLWCMPLLRAGGLLLAFKGGRVQEEMPAARKLLPKFRASQPVVHPVELPGAENHVIVEIVRN